MRTAVSGWLERRRDLIRRAVATFTQESASTAVVGITGLLIVHELPKEQYAMYTFLVSTAILLVGITDLGLVYCALPIVGTRADDRRWVVAVCRRIYQKRWILFSVGVPAVTAYAVISMRRHDWTQWWFVVALALTAAWAWTMLTQQFTGEILGITQSIRVLNRAGWAQTASRAVLICLALLPWWGDLRLALLMGSAVVATALAVAIHRRHIRGFGPIPDASPEERRAIDRRVVEIVRPLIVPGVYYQLQGYVTVLLATMAGTASVVADVGALGRLAMLLIIVDRVLSVLLMPRLARCTTAEQFDRLTRFGLGVYALTLVLATGSALAFPQLWLLLIGGQYANASGLIWIAVLSTVLYFFTGFLFRVLMTRGFSQGQFVNILFAVGSQVIAIAVVGVDTTRGVIVTGLASAIGQTTFQLIQLVRMRRREIRTVLSDGSGDSRDLEVLR
ncbi:hypothetical protein K8Z61_10360 [Nocardioides sp. TRM66260-LWL]|uniref:hypothetical protein n=1 Tax=Nocardioides sp. TRM66260-LWL TaxID=2874478 RepID=UPI001CC4D6A5|nr:hypothetical protein [Nocardioides sp. TRM66260-LWL]MBZ5734898.1 hypothetical protein [Nocardioides sp. TRM66260-LWL]